jgi:hypothetical protein
MCERSELIIRYIEIYTCKGAVLYTKYYDIYVLDLRH